MLVVSTYGWDFNYEYKLNFFKFENEKYICYLYIVVNNKRKYFHVDSSIIS